MAKTIKTVKLLRNTVDKNIVKNLQDGLGTSPGATKKVGKNKTKILILTFRWDGPNILC